MATYMQRAERYVSDMEEEYRLCRNAYTRMLSYDRKIEKMLHKASEAEEDFAPSSNILERQAEIRRMVCALQGFACRYAEKHWEQVEKN